MNEPILCPLPDDHSARDAYFSQLRGLSFSALQAMPESQEVLLSDDGKQKALLWRDVREDGRIQLVLQSLAGGSMCCLGEVVAAGYAISEAGEWTRLDGEALREFTMG